MTATATYTTGALTPADSGARHRAAVTGADQGLEFNDAATVSSPTQVSMTFHVYDTADAIRVITLAP